MTTISFADADAPDILPLRPYHPAWLFGVGWKLDHNETCLEPDLETRMARAQAGFSDPIGELSPEALAIPGPAGLRDLWRWLFG